MTRVFIISFCCYFNIYSQSAVNEELYNHAINAPYHVTLSIPSLVDYLVIPTDTDRDKLEIFYYWIASNINYDTDSYTSGNYHSSDGQTTLNNRKAVCQGYSELYKAMCDSVDIKCYIISGYAKGFAYETDDVFTQTNHAWNIVYVDDDWWLLDATWGSGYVEYKDANLIFTRKLKMEYFLATAEKFIEDHLPGNPIWQLLYYPVSMNVFLEYDSFDEMLNSSKEFMNFRDSISLFESLSSQERKVREAEKQFDFYPLNKENLALAYYNFAVSESIDTDHTALSKALIYYNKAREIYSTISNYKASEMLKFCDQGIEYVEYYLKR